MNAAKRQQAVGENGAKLEMSTTPTKTPDQEEESVHFYLMVGGIVSFILTAIAGLYCLYRRRKWSSEARLHDLLADSKEAIDLNHDYSSRAIE